MWSALPRTAPFPARVPGSCPPSPGTAADPRNAAGSGRGYFRSRPWLPGCPRPRGSERGQGSAPATSCTRGRGEGRTLRVRREPSALPAPHSPAAAGQGGGSPTATNRQGQGCHSHTQQGMENEGSLWPPALPGDGEKPSVFQRRGSSLIPAIGREAGLWRVRLGNGLQEPGSEGCSRESRSR